MPLRSASIPAMLQTEKKKKQNRRSRIAKSEGKARQKFSRCLKIYYTYHLLLSTCLARQSAMPTSSCIVKATRCTSCTCAISPPFGLSRTRNVKMLHQTRCRSKMLTKKKKILSRKLILLEMGRWVARRLCQSLSASAFGHETHRPGHAAMDFMCTQRLYIWKQAWKYSHEMNEKKIVMFDVMWILCLVCFNWPILKRSRVEAGHTERDYNTLLVIFLPFFASFVMFEM